MNVETVATQIPTVTQVASNPVIASIQKLCNSIGVRDKNGKQLIIDGIAGTLTS